MEIPAGRADGMDLLKDLTRELGVRGGHGGTGNADDAAGSTPEDRDRAPVPGDAESGEASRSDRQVCPFCRTEFEAARGTCPECNAEVVLRGER